MRRGSIAGLITVVLGAALIAGCGTPRSTPDVDVEAAPVPMLVDAVGWPEITTICLDMTAEGDLEPARGTVTPFEYVAAQLEALGIAIVADGCDAALAVDISARLIGADYGPTCYEGNERTGTASLTAPGNDRLEAGYAVSREPPTRIAETACTRDPQVPYAMWQGILTSDNEDDPGVLVQLLGARAHLARDLTLELHEIGFPSFVDNVEDPLAPWVIDTMAAALHADNRALRASAAHLIDDMSGDLWERSDEFLPLVPHLIWALAEEDQAEIDTLGEMDDGKGDIPYIRAKLGMALEEITNEEIDFRADLWWEWWLEQ